MQDGRFAPQNKPQRSALPGAIFNIFRRWKETDGLSIDMESLEQIGQGAMSKVFRAYDQYLQREVAVKIAMGRGATKNALKNEAGILKQLDHPGIPKYFSSGVFRSGPFSGRAFLEIEYLEGETLKAHLESKGSLSWEETRGIMIRICDAIQAVHDIGILHKDIKPDNIILTADGLKLLDFGVSGPQRRSLLGLMALPFKPGDTEYTAPEFFSGALDQRSDIYSAGAIMFRMLAGRPPLVGNELIALMGGILEGPKPLREYCQGAIPDSIERTLLRAISRFPELRFSTIGQMKAAIEHASG